MIPNHEKLLFRLLSDLNTALDSKIFRSQTYTLSMVVFFSCFGIMIKSKIWPQVCVGSGTYQVQYCVIQNINMDIEITKDHERKMYWDNIFY